MESTSVITNNIDDEFVDTRDSRELILSDQTMTEIIKSYSSIKSQKLLLTMAFKSLRSNNMMEFRRIICEQKDIVNIKHDGTYLIHEACRLGNADFVCLLLFLGAKCNIMDDKGLMAQHHAVIGHDPMCIDILFLFGNHMDVKDMHGNTPYEYVTKVSDDVKKEKGKKRKKRKIFLSSDDLENIMNQYEEPKYNSDNDSEKN